MAAAGMLWVKRHVREIQTRHAGQLLAALHEIIYTKAKGLLIEGESVVRDNLTIGSLTRLTRVSSVPAVAALLHEH